MNCDVLSQWHLDYVISDSVNQSINQSITLIKI